MKGSIAKLLTITTLLLLVAFCAQAQNDTRVTYIHTDADGTPFAATDEQGNLEWQIEHMPFGAEHRNTEVRRESNLSFVGKIYDEEIGLSYFGGRWYDPATGRFTGIDPMPVNPEDWGTFNRYSYGKNNPYKYNDPDGLEAEDPHGDKDGDGVPNSSENSYIKTHKVAHDPFMINGESAGAGKIGFSSSKKQDIHYQKHGSEFKSKNSKEYLATAHSVMKNGIKVDYSYKGQTQTGFVQFMGTNKKGLSKFAFVGTNKQGNITTLHTKSGKDVWRTINGNAKEKVIKPSK